MKGSLNFVVVIVLQGEDNARMLAKVIYSSLDYLKDHNMKAIPRQGLMAYRFRQVLLPYTV